MFKVYVVKQKRGGSEVLKDTRSATPSRAAATAAWAELYAKPFDARHLLLLTENGTKLAVHRFQAQPGDPDYLPPGDPLEP